MKKKAAGKSLPLACVAGAPWLVLIGTGVRTRCDGGDEGVESSMWEVGRLSCTVTLFFPFICMFLGFPSACLETRPFSSSRRRRASGTLRSRSHGFLPPNIIHTYGFNDYAPGAEYQPPSPPPGPSDTPLRTSSSSAG